MSAWWQVQINSMLFPFTMGVYGDATTESKGVNVAHEESLLLQLHRWCSRWDGKDGWMDEVREEDREREKWQKTTCQYSQGVSDWRTSKENTSIFIVLRQVANFLSPFSLSARQNGQGGDCEILIPVQRSRMPEVRKFISRGFLKERTLCNHKEGWRSEDEKRTGDKEGWRRNY